MTDCGGFIYKIYYIRNLNKDSKEGQKSTVRCNFQLASKNRPDPRTKIIQLSIIVRKILFDRHSAAMFFYLESILFIFQILPRYVMPGLYTFSPI